MSTEPHSRLNASRIPALRPRKRRPLLRLSALILVASGLLSCTSMWNSVREQERNYAVDNARSAVGRGNCASALASLDRAQARVDLGPYSRESTLARLRCYEKLGMNEMARAHRRLIDDFYTDEPMAFPNANRTSVFRVKDLRDGGFDRPPKWLSFPDPRYSGHARRSKIVGRVVIAFELAGNDTPRAIRVLEMPHPLLATWAIESIAAGRPKRKPEGGPLLMPGGRYVTTFLFEWRWAKEAPTNDLDS